MKTFFSSYLKAAKEIEIKANRRGEIRKGEWNKSRAKERNFMDVWVRKSTQMHERYLEIIIIIINWRFSQFLFLFFRDLSGTQIERGKKLWSSHSSIQAHNLRACIHILRVRTWIYFLMFALVLQFPTICHIYFFLFFQRDTRKTWI